MSEIFTYEYVSSAVKKRVWIQHLWLAFIWYWQASRCTLFQRIPCFIAIELGKDKKMNRAFFRIFIRLTLGLTITFAETTSAQAADDLLDTSFGSGGIVTTDFMGGDDFANDVDVQEDGKIIVVGTGFNGTENDFALVRYDPEGSLDTTFDIDGRVLTDFNHVSDLASAVAFQRDGKIVVAGSANNGADSDFAVARYNSDGSLDTTFDTDGKLTTQMGSNDDYGEDLVLQPDGRIVVAGFSHDNLSSVDNFVLARYSPDGLLDINFGSGGKVTTDFGCSAAAYAIVLQPDGKILAAGHSCGSTGSDFALARFNSDGSLDATFDIDGIVTTDFSNSQDSGFAVAVQPDGKIIVAGNSFTDPSANIVFALARYNTDGSLDMSFDGDGKVTTDLGGSRDLGYALALQPDGRIIVAGEHWQDGSNIDFVLARYNPDGSPDAAFGTDGKVITNLSPGDYGSSVAIQPDDKIIMAGTTTNANHFDFAVARYQVISPVREVAIDIKPDSQRNQVNPTSRGRIRVAILSAPDFDALTMIDQNTVRFGRTGDEDSLLSCKKKGQDVNHDGLRDLICEFSIRATGFRIGDTIGILTAQTIDGVMLRGSDSVKVVPDD
jgi:uncharacterized delta-60 repeat protein